MIEDRNYVPLLDIYQSILRLIERQVPAREGLAIDDLKKGILPAWSRSVGAKYVVYDLFRRISKEGTVFILDNDGRIRGYPSDILRPREKYIPCGEFSIPRRQLEQQGLISPDEFVFGWDSLKFDYWHSAFSNCRLFDDGTSNALMAVLRVYGAVPLIDWGTCTIELTRARTFLSSMDTLATQRNNLRGLGIIDDPEDWGRMAAALNCLEDGSLRSILKSLSPFDGCRVVAPTVWQKMIEQIMPDPTDTDQAAMTSPKLAILDAYRSNPLLSKQEIKQMLYPHWSERQFGKQWAAASEIDPAMARPGRRKIKS